MSFATVGITVACLIIMGTFTLVAVNANAMLADLESESQILAFVDLGASEEEARAMEKEILAVDNVAGATFISDVEAGAHDDEAGHGDAHGGKGHESVAEHIDRALFGEIKDIVSAHCVLLPYQPLPSLTTLPRSSMTTRLSKRLTRSFSWVTTSTVVPRALMRSSRRISA